MKIKKEYLIIVLVIGAIFIWQDRQNKQNLATMQASIEAQNRIIARLQTQPQPLDNLAQKSENLPEIDPDQRRPDPELLRSPDNLSQNVQIDVNVIPISPTALTQDPDVAPRPAPEKPSQPGAGPQLPQYGDISPPTIGNSTDGEVTAQNLTSVTEVWSVIKTMLEDLGIWGAMQEIFTVVIIISVVFIILSYFKA